MHSPTVPRAAAIASTPAITAVLAVATASPASAHERWFVENTDGGDWSFFLSPLPLALTATMVAVTVAWRLVARWLPSLELPPLRPLGQITAYVPRLLAIYLGISLLALAVTGDFLSHALRLRDVPGGFIAGLVEGILGVWFITGIRLRTTSLLFASLGPLALLAAGPVALLESAALFGIAAFLCIVPPSDRTFGHVKPDPAVLRTALLALRVGVATSLITLAFSEKFTNPELASDTLARYPLLDVFSQIGIQLPHHTFTAIAGSIELLFGLLLLSSALPQVVVLVAAVPFNATLLLFGQTELIGHLPVYGVFLALIIYGSSPATAPAVSWLPRLGSARPEAATPQVPRIVTHAVYRATSPSWPSVADDGAMIRPAEIVALTPLARGWATCPSLAAAGTHQSSGGASDLHNSDDNVTPCPYNVSRRTQSPYAGLASTAGMAITDG